MKGTYDWVMLLISGTGLLISPFTLRKIWVRGKNRDIIFPLISMFAMLFGQFITAWTGQNQLWAWSISLIITAGAFVGAIIWHIRSRRQGVSTDMILRSAITILVPAMMLFALVLHWLATYYTNE